jgi:hypothetical protein
MIRFIRALIYGAVAAMAATLVLDWLDRKAGTTTTTPRVAPLRANSDGLDQMSDDAKQALLDELAAQV